MSKSANRRQFLRASALATAALALPKAALGSTKRSLLVFTKSSGWEHDVVKRSGGHLSIVEQAVTTLGERNGFEVECSKDGRIFDSKEFQKHAAVLFFTTEDLT